MPLLTPLSFRRTTNTFKYDYYSFIFFDSVVFKSAKTRLRTLKKYFTSISEISCFSRIVYIDIPNDNIYYRQPTEENFT
jgi:hypothetical protein